MNFTKFASPVLLGLFMTCSAAKAADAYDACKTMMAKLAVQYDIDTLPFRVGGNALPQDGIVQRAERVVFFSYGMRKEELDKKWPRLWQFSVLTFVQAAKTLPRPESFREAAFLSCVREFS